MEITIILQGLCLIIFCIMLNSKAIIGENENEMVDLTILESAMSKGAGKNLFPFYYVYFNYLAN